LLEYLLNENSNEILMETTTQTKSAGPSVLTDRQMKQYLEDGYVIIRGVLDDAEVAKVKRLQAKIEARIDAHGATNFAVGESNYQFEKIDSPDGVDRAALRAVKNPHFEEPDFTEVAASDKILDFVEDLIGHEVYIHSSKVFFKAAHGGRRKPWHQDWAYWSHMNQQQVTVWMAIDPSTRENGCIEVLPGSHKKGHVEHYRGEDYMIHEELVDKDAVVYAEMAPGDVLFFNVLTLHASAPNNSEKGRLCCIIDFYSQAKPEGSRHGGETAVRSAEFVNR